MKILEWLGKPVMVLLNQLGPPRPAAEEQAEQARWKQHLDQYPVVRDVLALDAFARCWVHEHVFYEAVGKLLDGAKRAATRACWRRGKRTTCGATAPRCGSSPRRSAAAARDSEPVPAEGKGAAQVGAEGGRPRQGRAAPPGERRWRCWSSG